MLHYFFKIYDNKLSNDTTPVLIYTSRNQTSNNETNTKNKVILFSAIGSAGGLSLFLCVCCITISFCVFKKFKSKKNYKFIPRFVLYTISNNDNNIVTIYIAYIKCKEVKMTMKIITIW